MGASIYSSKRKGINIIMAKPIIKIRIKGERGSGKTTLLHQLGAYLSTLDYDVKCVDCGIVKNISTPNQAGIKPVRCIKISVVD